MDFYFTDRNFRLIEVATTTTDGEYSLTNDELVQSIADGSKTFTADLPFTPEQEKRVTEMAKVGNYVLFIDSRGHHNFQTIMETKKANFAINITCLDATVDLANETVDAYTADKAYPIAHYLELFTRDSGFEIGINEISNLSRKLKWDSSDETSKARILSVATQFDAELDFTFEITGTRVIKHYINIRKHNGSDKDIRLTLNHEVNTISTSENIWDLATSIRAIGGTPEGKDKPIDLNGYKWTDPSGRYVLRGATLLDTVANQYWTRLRTGGTSDTGAYINRVITYSAVTQAELLQSALADLKKRASVATTYEVDIAVLPDNVEIGDTVHIVDEKQELFLSARVLELTESYAFNTHKATLGDYLIEENEVSLSLQQLAEKMKTLANKPVYTWIAYADTADGQGISLFPDGKAYIGIAVNMADKNADISDPSKFNWQLTKGEPGQPGKDGSNGVPGTKGADGRTSYFHTAWADSENGSIGFTTSGGNGKKYVGTYSDFTQADSTEPSKYNWALFKGADGKDGYTPIKGTDYFDGKDGQDGKSSYLWIRYSANANGDGMTSDPTGAKYVGYATTQTATAPTSSSAYKWQLVAGRDGIPGEKGTDGKTSYLHIRYSNDGGKTFTANSGENVGTYIGQYTDFTQSDSNSVSDYKWALIKGEKGDTGSDGKPGKDGIGLATTTVTYQESTSGTTRPSGTWSTGVPTLSKGQYLWTRTVWTYTDNTSETGYSVSYIAKDGNDGNNGVAGKDGVGIKSTTITYASSASGTTAPTSGWTANPPATSAGQFIWTKTVWSYTDGTSETGYSVGKIGEKGEKGDTGADGVAGKDGIGIKSTAITYALGDSGTATPTTGWTTSVPSLIKGKYLWTKTVWLYTDNTSESGYSATYIGKDGNDGNNGLAGKDGVGISATKVEYAGSTSGTNKPTSGWTSTVPSVVAGNFLWTRTTWSYTDGTSESGYSVAKMGEKGDQGIKGPAGADGKSSYTHIAYANIKFICKEKQDFTLAKASLVRYGSDSRWVYKEFQAGTYTAETALWGQGDPAVGVGKNAELVSEFSTSNYVNKTYIGMYVDQTATDSNDPSKYKWTLIKGADGRQGTPGTPGVNGRTPYFHQAWADSQDGKTNFSTTISLGKKYLGTYTDYVASDSTDPAKYKWTELVGAIEIGGRNYIKNSDQAITINGDTDHYKILYFNLTPGSWTFSANAEYTRGTDTGVAIKVYNAGHSVVVKEISAPVVNGKITATFDVPDTGKELLVYASHDEYYNTPGKTIEIDNYKLEQGNKATDWSPAPEDVQAYTDKKAAETLAKAKDEINLVPKITSGTSFPSTRKTGDMHWMTDSAGVVTGYYKFNGSQWVVQKIDAQSLNVSSLSALSANLGTVTAGTINGVDINGSKFMSENSRVIADDGGDAQGLYTIGTTLTNTQTLDRTGYTSVSYGSIMGDKTPNSFKATTTIDNTSRIDSRADFLDTKAWSLISIDPTQSALTMINSDGTTGVLDASYLSMVNNCGEILWSGNMFMQSGQIITPSINLTKCLYGWNLVWQPYEDGVALDYGGVIVTPVYKTIAMSIGKTHAWNYGMYSYLHGNAFLTKYFYVGSQGDTISGNDQNSVGNSRYYVLTKVLAF